MIIKRSPLILLLGIAAFAIDATNGWSVQGMSRRDAFSTVSGIAASAVLLPQSPAFAAAGAGTPTEADLDRLKKGYQGLEYLLDHFEEETTICRENGGECKRNADAVRKYLGLRSTTDPLFQVEKIFLKVKNLDLDVDKLEAFFEATEDWNSAMNMSNSMAFISEFGEYNPGGTYNETTR